MSPLHSAEYGLDAFRVVESPPSPITLLRRRLAGRYMVDPFGLDPQLADLVEPVLECVLRVEVEGGERIPHEGPVVLVSNRALGLVEPAVLAVAVRRTTGRRLRAVGAPHVPVAEHVWRRFGVVGRHPSDLASLLRAGHIVAVPLGPSGLRTLAGPPPLSLCAAMIGYRVLPVAVVPVGPLGLPLGGYRVRVGAHIALDSTYEPGDPLAAAELGEAARDAVEALLEGAPTEQTPLRPDLAAEQ